jgi:hypothetical protein
LSGKDRAGLGERRLIFVPQGLARECREVISDLVSLDVPNEGAGGPAGKLETFENIDIQGELNGIVKLRLAVAFVVAAFLAPARLDVDRHIAARLFSQEVRYTEQVLNANAATVNQGIASGHGLERQSLRDRLRPQWTGR